MASDKTHREIKTPQITARYLAEYMAATETAQRTIVRNAKYQSRARVLQHNEAKVAVGSFIRQGDASALAAASQALRHRMADDDFDRHLFDTNADYIDRFATVSDKLEIPDAERLPPGAVPPVVIGGTKLTVELAARLRRTMKITNRVRTGGVMLRYTKGKALDDEVGAWQSAALFGYLRITTPEDMTEPEQKLCVTVDAWSGLAIPAPSDSLRRFHEMESALATIAERWPNVKPPPKAIF